MNWRRIPAAMAVAAMLTLLAMQGAAGAAEGDSSFTWNLGSDADVDAAKTPHIEPPDRIGPAGKDGDTAYRSLKSGAFQVMFHLPAFDFDAANFGAINHPFYLAIRFKDTAKTPATVCAGKGGSGFYGAGYVGTFGGANDGQWKEETLVIPRSMMRCTDGKTFLIKMTEVKSDFPIASMTLFSAGSTLPGTKEKVAAAEKFQADKRDALRQKLLPKFKDLGLPDPGPAPEFTAAEKKQGFRVFFPPVSRQLFANSQPQEGELPDFVKLDACPGQTLTLVAAVRAIEPLEKVKVEMIWPKSNSAGKIETGRARWAVYSEQKIGSSWGKDFRVCPEQLVEAESRDVKPDRLEIVVLTLKVPAEARAETCGGILAILDEKGRRADINLQITIYPFKLEHPDHSTHGQFYYIDYADINPFEVKDMAEHGMDMVVSDLGWPVAGPAGKQDTSKTRAAFKFLKANGYRAPLIDNTGYMNPLLKDEKNRKQYADIIAETMKIAKEEGFDTMGFFPVDEPHTADLQAKAKTACTWTKDAAGANTFITSNPKAVPVLDDVLNYVCYNLTYLNPQTIKSMKPHQTLMYYCPSIDVNPEYNRFRPGFYQYKIAAHSGQFFAYFEFAGDPFCDLDGDHRDWNVAYPSMTSPTHDPTLEWEAMREGVYDWQYCYTLSAAVERARKAGKTAAADAGQKVLDEVLSAVDVDGNKAGGPAIAIEADTRLKNKQLKPEELAAAKSLLAAGWYDQSRRKLAAAIIEVQKALAPAGK